MGKKTLDLICVVETDTVYSFIHQLCKSFNNSICKYSVHLYRTPNLLSVMKFSFSLDAEPLEYINSVVLFALWPDVFVVHATATLCQKFRILITGILDCYEELERKAFGLSWGIKFSFFTVVDNRISSRTWTHFKIWKEKFKFLHYLILKSVFKIHVASCMF